MFTNSVDVSNKEEEASKPVCIRNENDVEQIRKNGH